MSINNCERCTVIELLNESCKDDNDITIDLTLYSKQQIDCLSRCRECFDISLFFELEEQNGLCN